MTMKEVQRDEVLPHMNIALDSPMMKGILQMTLLSEDSSADETKIFRDRHQIHDCQIDWIKYKPGKNCTVSYRLFLTNGSSTVPWEQRLYARVYEPGGSFSRFNKEQTKNFITPKVGKSIVHIPQFDILN